MTYLRARRYMLRAEETRTIAACTDDATCRAQLVELAKGWDRMAVHMTKLADSYRALGRCVICAKDVPAGRVDTCSDDCRQILNTEENGEHAKEI